MYLFSSQFLEDLVARLTGPMSFRFFLQPAVAVMLGIRDGIMDAKAGAPPFVYNVVFCSRDRKAALKGALRTLSTAIVVGTVLDAIAQYLIFKKIHPLPALLVGAFVMGVPYSLARGISNRIASARCGKPAKPEAEERGSRAIPAGRGAGSPARRNDEE